jgi:hypothetical protein
MPGSAAKRPAIMIWRRGARGCDESRAVLGRACTVRLADRERCHCSSSARSRSAALSAWQQALDIYNELAFSDLNVSELRAFRPEPDY